MWHVPDCKLPAPWCKISNIFSEFRNCLFHTALIMCGKFTRVSLVSLRWLNTGFPLIGFFVWAYICTFEYCGNICKRFLPLTLKIWYSALIWQEPSTNILGIFCFVCLLYHLILCYTVFSWIEAVAFFCFFEKNCGLYSRAASMIYFVLTVCYLQVITSITFVFSYISFVFQFWKPLNKLPKPLHCCRIQRNSKQFVNNFGTDC